jgi:hypothetical protein
MGTLFWIGLGLCLVLCLLALSLFGRTVKHSLED